MSTPERFDPLGVSPEDTNVAIHYARNRVKNIVESYHGRFDALAESIQNAVDAIEARWQSWDGTSGGVDVADGERPMITVTIDSQSNVLTVTDNGIGIASDQVVSALIPNVSPKGQGANPTRGHKGVGTTFLAYGHNNFVIHTKAGAENNVAFELRDGLSWVNSAALDPAPFFEPIDPPDSPLTAWTRGTHVALQAGDRTTIGNLRTHFNKFEHWELILRTFTAAGYVAIGNRADSKPHWAERLRIELQLKGVPNPKTADVPFAFPYPHTLMRDKDRRELSWLERNPNTKREYRLIYVDRSFQQLKSVLEQELGDLRKSDDEETRGLAELFESYEIDVYASIACENTLYDDLNRDFVRERDAQRGIWSNINGGVLVASVSMPIGELHSHLRPGIRPELKRRFFLLVHFNSRYSPDIGRKTIPRRDERLVAWVEDVVRNILERQTPRLIRDKDEETRGGGSWQAAKEELADAAEKLRVRSEHRIVGAPLAVPFPAVHEDEVIANFAGLVAAGCLPGYALIGVPGNTTRYDGMFDYVVYTTIEPLVAAHRALHSQAAGRMS